MIPTRLNKFMVPVFDAGDAKYWRSTPWYSTAAETQQLAARKAAEAQVNTKHQLNHKITEGKRNATTLTENMVEASSSFPSLSSMDNACLSNNSAINCKRSKDLQVFYLDNTINLTRAKVSRLGAKEDSLWKAAAVSLLIKQLSN